MTELVVQSRFAGLKIEDDDHPSYRNQETKKNKTPNSKVENTKKSNSKNNVTKTQNGMKKKKTKQTTAPSGDQWKMWKQKDEQLVDGNFESELQEAIILSKLDYEEKKEIYKQLKKQSEIEKKIMQQSIQSNSKKQKKKNVMSLEQFNEKMAGGDEAKCNHVNETDIEGPEPPGVETAFFEKIEDETKIELVKDKAIDQIRSRLAAPDEVITRAHFLDALERKDKELLDLKNEVITLKEELLKVKSRNKKLCNILGHCEMREKAELAVELDRMRGVQSELTAELAELHARLEQERSKHPDAKTKDRKKVMHPTKKKSVRFDASTDSGQSKDCNSTTA